MCFLGHYFIYCFALMESIDFSLPFYFIFNELLIFLQASFPCTSSFGRQMSPNT